MSDEATRIRLEWTYQWSDDTREGGATELNKEQLKGSGETMTYDKKKGALSIRVGDYDNVYYSSGINSKTIENLEYETLAAILAEGYPIEPEKGDEEECGQLYDSLKTKRIAMLRLVFGAKGWSGNVYFKDYLAELKTVDRETFDLPKEK